MSVVSASEMDAINVALNATFSALADPTRRAMLARLSQGEASVNELAAPFKMSLPAVSKHIKVLERAGLLIKTRSAQQRPCKIDGVQLKQAVDWIDQYKQLWEGRLDRLDAYLLELQARETAAKPVPEKALKATKSTKVRAKGAMNTPATAKNSTKNQFKPEKTPQKPKEISETKEKNDDNAANDLQQQIGFDF